jgi:hypothetical protein
MRAIYQNSLILNKDWTIKEFKDEKAIIRYAIRTMPADLKKLGFGVAIFHGEGYIRFSYGRKC